MERIAAAAGLAFQLAEPEAVRQVNLIGRGDELARCAEAWGFDLDHGRMLRLRQSPLNFLLFGPAGVGKSAIVHALAHRIGAHLYTILGHSDLRPEDLALTITPNREGASQFALRASPLATAIYTGGLFYFDRIECVPEKTLSVLAPVLDGRQSIYSATTGATITPADRKAARNFRFCCSMSSGTLPSFLAERCVPIIHVRPLASHHLRSLAKVSDTVTLRDHEAYKEKYQTTSRDHVTLRNLEHLAAYVAASDVSKQDLLNILLQFLSLREKVLSEEHPEIAQATQQLAAFAESIEAYDQAAKLWEGLIATEESTLNSTDGFLLKGRMTLARLYLDAGRPAEADTQARHVLDACRANPEPESPLLGNALNILGIAHRRLANYGGAIEYYKEALHIHESSSLENNASIALTTGNIGTLYFYSGQYRESEAYLSEALKLNAEALGPDHPDGVTVMNGFARLQLAFGHYPESRSMYERVQKLRNDYLPESHSDKAFAYDGMAVLSLYTGDCDGALEYAKLALTLRNEALTRTNPLLAESLHTCGIVHRGRHELEDSRTHFKEALLLREQILRKRHPDIAVTMSALGDVLADLGQIDEAELLLQGALDILRDELGDDRPQTVVAIANFSKLQLKQGEHRVAAAGLRRALATQLGILAKSHPDLVRTAALLESAEKQISGTEACT